jgi:hypothetical protein
MTPMESDPVCNIEWIHAGQLEANSYNPNVCFNAELRLLERSILLTGWVQPVLISRENMIIDGFHRTRLALDSRALMDRYGGMVPCSRLDVDRPTAMIMTIRMNRAKGSHVAIRMSEVVRELVADHGIDKRAVADEIGATMDEIDLLLQDGVFKKKNIKDYKYSKAWYPVEAK